MSAERHADHIAYLTRKLDLHERELALREREVAVQERMLEQRLVEIEHLRRHEDELDSLQDLLDGAVMGAVPDRKRGRA